MPQFYYSSRRTMTPHAGQTYATVYLRQTPTQHQALLAWLVGIAHELVGACDRDPEIAAWFDAPHRSFKKSQKNTYYSPGELLTDMIGQLNAGRDLPEAMLNRWNRLAQGTEWSIDLVLPSQSKTQRTQDLTALFELE